MAGTDYTDGDFIYQEHWRAMKQAIDGNGIVSGCVVSQDGGGASHDIDIAAGVLYVAGNQVVYAGGSQTIATNGAGNDR